MFQPRPHQIEAIAEGIGHFARHDRGKMVMAFRSGKTVTAALLAKRMGMEKVLFQTPTLPLQKQAVETWSAIFPQSKVLCIGSDQEVAENLDVSAGVTTKPDEARFFMEKYRDNPVLVFCTYQSGAVLAIAAEESGTVFDLGVFDEAHRTAGGRDNLFPLLLKGENIRIRKRLFMTATEKFFKGDTLEVASMDDETMYGSTFYRLSVAEAIRKHILCDYSMVTMWFTSDEIAALVNTVDMAELQDSLGVKKVQMRILTAAVATVRALQEGTVRKLIVYHNTVIDSKRYVRVLRKLADYYKLADVDVEHVDGRMKTKYEALARFKNAKRAVVSNCRLILEGFDAPSCDGVLFAMPKSSVIDISQMAGRVMTKDAGKERGYVLIPAIVSSEDEFFKSDEYANLRMVVAGMAAADDRITYTLSKSGEKTNSKHLRVWASESAAQHVDVDSLTASMRLKVWKHVGKLNWMTYEEAKKWVAENLVPKGINTRTTFRLAEKPVTMPPNPDVAYRKMGWVNWADFLSQSKNDFLPYEEARAWVLENLVPKGIDSAPKFRKYVNDGGDLPPNIPAHPDYTYRNVNGGFDYSNFFGRRNPKKIWPIKKAKAWVRKNAIRSISELGRIELPEGFPVRPDVTYAEKGWKGIFDFFGIDDPGESMTFEEMKDWVKQNVRVPDGIKNYKKWWTEYHDKHIKHAKILKFPDTKFGAGKGWKGWKDFFGK